MRSAALACGLIVLLLGGWLAAKPFLLRDRDLLTTTPQPSPLDAVSLVQLRGRERACLDQAVVDERSESVRFRVGTYGRRPPPLRLTIRGRGYAQSERIAPADYGDNDVLFVPIEAPDAAVLTAVCIRNEGRRRIALYAAQDRTVSRSATRVDGDRVGPNVVIQFAESRPGSLLRHLPVTIRRLTVFRPVGEWFIWSLAILFAVAMPLAVLAAYARSLSDPEER